MNLPLLKEMETQNGAHPLHGLPHLAHPIRATGGRTYVKSWQMASSRCLLGNEKDTFLSLSIYSHP